MAKRFSLLFAAFVVTHLAVAAARADTARPKPPNIVVIAAEDIGYGDLGSFGQKTLKTPALDALAAEGMRFTQFYAGGVTPADSMRVLLTGRHAGRQPPAATGDKPATAPSDLPSLTSMLKKAGYATATLNVQGKPDVTLRHWDDAVDYLRQPKQSPFLMVLSPTPPTGDADGFADRDWPPAEKRFAARLRDIDRDVGRLVATLKERGVEKNTLVLFLSLTGPNAHSGRDAAAFDSDSKYRCGPGELLEGSIRVPMIAWWPGTTPAGAENDRQWYVGDIVATAAELAGVKLPNPAEKPKPDPATLFDSDSLVPALRGEVNPDQWSRRSRLYWASTAGPTSEVVRFGKWKAIRSPMITGPVELFDMSNDPTEKRDYAPRRADLAKHATNLLNSSRVVPGAAPAAPQK